MYSSTDILEGMTDGRITISDFDPERLGPNSYDLILGDTFFNVTWDDDGPLYVGPFIIHDGGRVNIPVSGTLLAKTRDIIGTKENVVCKLQAKSSVGRIGITICRDAGLGDVGYDNHWTMELSAQIVHGQPFLFVGQQVAQAVFYEVKTPPIKEYSGQYFARDWPLCMVPAKYRDRVVRKAP